VDDWTKGYSIYKVDLVDLDGVDPGADLDSLATPLPGPPVFRLESYHANYSHPWFSSVGGRIAAMHYNEEEEDAPPPPLRRSRTHYHRRNRLSRRGGGPVEEPAPAILARRPRR
jgi:hypothetical protein